MLENGHVKVHRSIINWEWYTDTNTKSLFLHLLLVANWKDENWRGYDVKRGQKITSRENLARETGLSEQQVRTCLKKLKSTNEITIKTTNKFTVITINNYDEYQDINQQPNQQVTNNQPTSNQQVTTNEESKKAIKQEVKNNTPKPPTKSSKKKYAEFVHMTTDEYNSLIEKVGEHGANRCVEILDNYKGANGKKYKSDYRAILNWVISRYKEEKNKPAFNAKPQDNYSDPSQYENLSMDV